MATTAEHPATLYIAERALAEIAAETLEHFYTETGGVLLGVEEGGDWYAVESLDPGPGAILERSFFEYNHHYMSHLADKVARRYRRELRLIGLWHRHPGSFDSFSAVDDGTNLSYAELLGGKAISGLVNVDPEFRMTFYQVQAPPLGYRRIRVCTGDDHFPRDLLATRSSRDTLETINSKASERPDETGPWELFRPPRRRGAASTDDGVSPDPHQPRSALEEQGEETRNGNLPGADRGAPGTPVEGHTGGYRLEPADTWSGSIPSVRGALLQLLWWLGFRRSAPMGAAPRRAEPRRPRPSTDEAAAKVQILEMLDEELDFLERQSGCSYSLSMDERGLCISLTKSGGFRETVRRLRLYLRSANGQRTVWVGDRQEPYVPGTVQRLVSDWLERGHSPMEGGNRDDEVAP